MNKLEENNYVEGTTNNEFSDNRKVILHYHLFKNAGTSLDCAFKNNLGNSKWVTKEFPSSPSPNRVEVAQWIIEESQAVCFSSHTAELPVPSIEGIEVFPIIFVRHPIDRIASAYTFESRQNASSFGSTLARNTSLAGYIETRLSIKSDCQCCDFHAHRLASMYSPEFGDVGIRSTMAFDELPYVGLVETYAASLKTLNEKLKAFGIENVHLANEERNVSRGSERTLEQKLCEIRSLIGVDLYSHLEQHNALDIKLFERALAQYQ